ncbi:MAG: hypothetical protein U5M72_05730 [Pseudomonas sp.]|nr:hypothetical protein [Pseudomonas sp.]
MSQILLVALVVVHDHPDPQLEAEQLRRQGEQVGLALCQRGMAQADAHAAAQGCQTGHGAIGAKCQRFDWQYKTRPLPVRMQPHIAVIANQSVLG